MHPLKLYLHEIDETIQDFSRRVGVSRQTLYRIIAGRQTPRPALARRIVEATGGAIGLEALYPSVDEAGDVVELSAHNETVSLEYGRIKVALATIINHMSPQAEQSPTDEIVSIAAEAVVNTYAALSRVTSRQGPDRLKQALRPVLEEILQEISDSPLSSAALDQGAALAAQLYFQPHLRDTLDLH